MANFSLGSIGFPIHGNTNEKDQGDKDDPYSGIKLHPGFRPENGFIPGISNPQGSVPQGNHDLPPDEDTDFGGNCAQPCPPDTTCVPYHGKFECVCEHTLRRPGPGGSCTEEHTTKVPKVNKHIKIPDHTVAPPKRNKTSNVIDHLSLNDIVEKNKQHLNDTTTSGLLRTKPAPIERQPDWKILQIALPVGFFLFLSIIVALLLMRRWRHSRSSKRSSDGVVKNSDNVQLLERMNIISKNPTYFTSLHEGVEGKELYVREIPLDQLKLVEVVGEGAFGQVFKGDLFNSETNCGTKVAVKVLKEGVCCEIREDFEREVEIMSAFDHDNILRLIGVVTQNVGESPYMVFEYMEYGDLAELLRKNDPILRKTDDCVVLQKNDLGDIAIQIANGMTYLTSQHFVHRDLATRNCLVGEGLVVKISDFGMSRDIYTCDYYKIGGSRMLPVRWMSPESVKYGRFTSESDVWAYGVVLWEIYSCGRQPYYGHSNEEVIRFLDEKIYLQRPEECPDAIYNVMTGCWKQEPKERLTFERIQRLLAEYNKKVVLNEIIEKSMDSSSLNEVLA